MSSITDLANSIAQMEGFNTAGTIANRNNNPGNLRYAPTQTGSEQTVNGKFATFATAEDGWNALYSYIQSKANSGQTLRDFIYSYAPPSENVTSNYLNYLSGQLGVGADSSLASLGATDVNTSGMDTTGIVSNINDIVSSDSTGLMIGAIGVAVVAALIVNG